MSAPITAWGREMAMISLIHRSLTDPEVRAQLKREQEARWATQELFEKIKGECR